MIVAIQLCHPQSVDILEKHAFNTKYVERVRISCGTTKMKDVDFSESNDFFPTYAPWNSALFETSVILTAWEHADQLIGQNNVAVLHSDIKLHFKPAETWKRIDRLIQDDPKRAIGITVPSTYMGLVDEWLLPESVPFFPKHDPMLMNAFDNGIHVWDYIKQYDHDIHDWAFDTQPRLIYAHQFACSRVTFDHLGSRLYDVAHRLRLQDAGFWTPHMFERLIGLYLARYGGTPVLTSAFWLYASSGTFGPGEHSLYGPRALRFYKTVTRWNQRQIDVQVAV